MNGLVQPPTRDDLQDGRGMAVNRPGGRSGSMPTGTLTVERPDAEISTNGANGNGATNGNGASNGATNGASNGNVAAALNGGPVIRGDMDPCEAGQLEACANLRIAEREITQASAVRRSRSTVHMLPGR